MNMGFHSLLTIHLHQSLLNQFSGELISSFIQQLSGLEDMEHPLVELSSMVAVSTVIMKSFLDLRRQMKVMVEYAMPTLVQLISPFAYVLNYFEIQGFPYVIKTHFYYMITQ